MNTLTFKLILGPFSHEFDYSVPESIQNVVTSIEELEGVKEGDLTFDATLVGDTVSAVLKSPNWTHTFAVPLPLAWGIAIGVAETFAKEFGFKAPEVVVTVGIPSAAPAIVEPVAAISEPDPEVPTEVPVETPAEVPSEPAVEPDVTVTSEAPN